MRDLKYDINSDGYNGNDLSIYSPHLFDGHTLVDLAYAENPHSVVWAIRSDGALLGMTYLREQEIWGWHRHDTGNGDTFENVCVVAEGAEDAVYVVVKRTIDGQTKRYIERLASRFFTDIRDAFFVDSGLTYDGRNDTATTLTLSGSGWTSDDELTLTASASIFVAGDVGNAYHLNIVTPADEDTPAYTTTIRCEVSAYTSGTVVTIRPHINVPVAFRTVAITDWVKAVDEISGLQHLEGRTVSVFADGNAISNGHDIPAGVDQTILDAELDLEDPNGESIAARKKIVTEVTLRLDATRGGFWGPDKTHLTEMRQRSDEGWNVTTNLFTGTKTVRIESTWNSNGRIFVRQRDPLPISILSAHPKVEVGG